jgi:hypothetical protein
MSPYKAFEIYVAVKTHFNNPSFDFHKFNGKTRLTTNSFESRDDKSFFYRICKKYSRAKLIDLFVANFVDNPGMWIGDFLLDKSSEEIYAEWQKRIESLSYHFSEECTGLLEWMQTNGFEFNDLFRIKDFDHPIIVKMALQKVISLETFIILDRILDFGRVFDRRLTDVIWKNFWLKIQKYSPFINIDLEKSKMILRNKMVKEYKYATTSNRS